MAFFPLDFPCVQLRTLKTPRDSAQFRTIQEHQFRQTEFRLETLGPIHDFFHLEKGKFCHFLFLSVLRKSAIYFKNWNSKLKIYGFIYSPHLFSRLNLSYICTSLCLSFFLFVCMSDHNFRTPALTALHLIFLGNYGNIFSFVNTSKFKV